MTRWTRTRGLVGLTALPLMLAGLAGIAPVPRSSAADTLLATVVETSDLHADGGLNDGHLLATSRVAAAQNPDAIMLAGDLTNHGYASEFSGLWGSGWGALKPKILASPGNHEEDYGGQAEFKSQFGYTRSYNSMDVNGVHLIALDVDITSTSPSMLVGGEQYTWLQNDLAAHAGMPILAMSHFPRYSVGGIHGDQDSTEIRNEWTLLQQAGAEIVFAGHDHTYQRFPRANADGTLSPTSGLRELIGATGGSGDLYPTSLRQSVLTPDYYQNTVEGVVRISIFTDHLEWAHIGVDGVTRDHGSAPLNHPLASPGNTAPTVEAGTGQAVTLPAAAHLDATVTDDGLPNPPGTVTTTWSTVIGPGTVTFADPGAVDTTASFSSAGTYVLRLTATDSDAAASDTVSIDVWSATGSGTIDRRVATGSDDVEQAVSGSVYLNSSDLELTTDGSTQQVVGTRFADVQLPRGATITAAYVQFRVDESSSGLSSMTIRAEDSDSAPTYPTTSGSVTARPVTGSVAWSPPDWTTVGAAGLEQRTPDIASLVRAVVARPGWQAGNALALQFSGTGRRTAVAYEGSAAGAALLHIEYTTGTTPTNTPPVVDAGPARTVVLPASASLDGTVTDDGLPDPPGAVATTWSKVSGPGTVTFGSSAAVDTTAAFSQAGTYVLQLSADDSAATTTDTVTVTVQEPGAGTDTLHYVANEGGAYETTTALGFNVHDTGMSASVINALPPGTQALVWTGTSKCPTSLSTTFTSFVDANAANPRIFGYYLVDEPSDPSPACVDGIKAMADYIHGHSTFQKAMILLTDYPGTYQAYTPATSHVDLVGLDPYPCRWDNPSGCDLTMIGDTVTAAEAAGTPRSAMVPVFQEFGDPSIWRAPTSTQLEAILAEWRKYVPVPVLDYVYTWGCQQSWNETDCLAVRSDWQAVMRTYFGGVGNLAPAVDAGPARTVVLPAVASLDGTVTDDGLPNPPGTVATMWSKVSGPGTVTFGSSTAVDTTAVFSEAGTYVLQLTASDSAATSTDTVTVTVEPAMSPNGPPVVDAGSAQTITLPAGASLDGTVTDDALPDPPGTVATMWSKVSGPGTVTFGSSTAVDTTAAFSQAGTYVLQLSADDSAATSSDTVTITVNAAGSTFLDRRIAAGSDDAEQVVQSGAASLTSTTLELTTDGNKQQVVATRFAGLQIPRGAIVAHAHVQFQAEAVSTGASSMVICAEDSDNAATYAKGKNTITARATTCGRALPVRVPWSPTAWSTAGAAGVDQRTSDIAPLVQAVIDRPGWVTGHAIALQFMGTGRRVAESFEGSRTGAPLLHVEWAAGEPVAATRGPTVPGAGISVLGTAGLPEIVFLPLGR